MNEIMLVILVNALALFSVHAEDRDQTRPRKSIPFLEERLHSTRWEVRYCLLADLAGRDEASKNALQILIRDKHQSVANQALVRYVRDFVIVDKGLFDPKVYAPGRFPLTDLPDAEPNKALVDYCLGRRKITPKGDLRCGVSQPDIAVLDPKKRDDPSMYIALTIVGILGQAEDAPLLYPFLESTNDYVVVGAAKALLRLGDKGKAFEALSRLTGQEPREHLFYIVEALYILREAGHPEYKDIVIRVLKTVDKTEGIQPNWVNEFIILASEVKADVWK